MGLFSTFSSSKSSSTPSSSPKASGFSHMTGKISKLEIGKVHRDLISRLGRTKGERAYSQLLPNMDRERGIGSSGISANEARDVVRNMEKNPYDGLDKHDAAKVGEVLGKRLDS